MLRSSLKVVDGKVFQDRCMPRCFDNYAEIIQAGGDREFKGESSETVSAYPIDIVLPAQIKRANKVVLKVSIVICAKSV